jgi:hypothetical protein
MAKVSAHASESQFYRRAGLTSCRRISANRAQRARRQTPITAVIAFRLRLSKPLRKVRAYSDRGYGVSFRTVFSRPPIWRVSYSAGTSLATLSSVKRRSQFDFEAPDGAAACRVASRRQLGADRGLGDRSNSILRNKLPFEEIYRPARGRRLLPEAPIRSPSRSSKKNSCFVYK